MLDSPSRTEAVHPLFRQLPSPTRAPGYPPLRLSVHQALKQVDPWRRPSGCEVHALVLLAPETAWRRHARASIVIVIMTRHDPS
eukprot:scaffold1074_cov409-Prasinococcus_capsulatus_cf.AAC.30